jgi:hypothetical protein
VGSRRQAYQDEAFKEEVEASWPCLGTELSRRWA